MIGNDKIIRSHLCSDFGKFRVGLDILNEKKKEKDLALKEQNFMRKLD